MARIRTLDDSLMTPEEQEHLSLCEALDRILNKGAVVVADISISVADIDLVYISLQALITSVETGRQLRSQSSAYTEEESYEQAV